MSFQRKTPKSRKPDKTSHLAAKKKPAKLPAMPASLGAWEEVRESCEQLRALAARLQAAREEDRIRISREMHDQLGEMLTGLKLSLGWMRALLESENAPIAREQLLEN